MKGVDEAGCEALKLSVIIPVLNEIQALPGNLQKLQFIRQVGHEIILVDGGSEDGTVESASGLVDKVVRSERGRARQMHAGASHARGRVYLFLHADTLLPENTFRSLESLPLSPELWGRFDVTLSGNAISFRIIEFFTNLRSRLTGIATGDQGMFINRELYNAVGGFPQIALMEDIAMSKLLKRYARPVCLKMKAITSSRRWEDNGVWRTVLLMWSLRLRYLLGVAPDRLARDYD